LTNTISSRGKKVLLYAEVDNFAAKETPRGFHTALREQLSDL
jgi:hypothetical protein